MGTEKYISEIKLISAPQEVVYNCLSNFKNLEQLFDPKRMAEIKKQYPEAPDIKLENFQATADECSFTISPIGTVGVQIVEREPSKTIKLAGSKSVPFQFSCWIQLVAADEASCKVKITLHAELNPMFKMLVNKHLKNGVDQIAEALTKIPYTQAL
jgi:carbon monoxide dehydrogenase subunit G